MISEHPTDNQSKKHGRTFSDKFLCTRKIVRSVEHSRTRNHEPISCTEMILMNRKPKWHCCTEIFKSKIKALVAFFAPSFLGRAMLLGVHFNNVVYCHDFEDVTIDGV